MFIITQYGAHGKSLLTTLYIPHSSASFYECGIKFLPTCTLRRFIVGETDAGSRGGDPAETLETSMSNTYLWCTPMIYITQLIYLVPGKEETFEQFEAVAIPLIAKYNGRLLFRVRPGDSAYIESNTEKPYEIHLVEFEAAHDFENFKKDEERKKFLHLKEQSIKTSIMILGSKL